MRIESPDSKFKGEGPGGIMFVDGAAETDDPAIIGYCQGAGYTVGGERLNAVAADPRQAVPADPRDVTTTTVGSPLRDAAVDPQPGDNPPAGAGQGNPHGPEVVANGTPPQPPATPDEGGSKAPARSSSKADWVAYATSPEVGMDQAEAEGKSRDQLAERFLGPKDA